MTPEMRKKFYTAAGRLTSAGLIYGLRERKKSNDVEARLGWGENAYYVALYCPELGAHKQDFRFLKNARSFYDNWGRGSVACDVRFRRIATGLEGKEDIL